MKVVLSNDVEKCLDITLKLWYLQQKYGEICAFVYLYKADMWVKIHDPFIILPDDRSYIRYFTDNDIYSKISACSGYSWFYNEGIDMNLLDLNHLRFDEHFIRVVKIHRNTKECAHLRIEDVHGSKEDIIKNIVVENGIEKVLFNRGYTNMSFQSNNAISLPCNIGDTIYTYRYNFEDNEFEIIDRPIKDIKYSVRDSTIMISDGEFLREFGKEMFLTREEAENYLNSLPNK